MCLGFPGRIVSIKDAVAVIDCWGTEKRVRIDTLEETVFAGDFLIEHDGVAVRRIPSEDVEDTLALYETVLGETLIPA